MLARNLIFVLTLVGIAAPNIVRAADLGEHLTPAATADAPQLDAREGDPLREGNTASNVPSASSESVAYVSRVGDQDDFGVSGGSSSLDCYSSFDNRGPDDLGVFDTRRPGGAVGSVCAFAGGWTHTFTPPPGGAGRVTLRLRELGGRNIPAICAFTACGCTPEPTPTITVNGTPYSYDTGSCSSVGFWQKTWTGAEATALAASGSVTVSLQWGNSFFAIDYAELILYPLVNVAVEDGDAQRGVPGYPVEKALVARVTSPDPAFNASGRTVLFEITGTPRRAVGQGVGAVEGTMSAIGATPIAETGVAGAAPEETVSMSYVATADADGLARARLVLGDVAGAYSVRVSTFINDGGSDANFLATAVKPTAVVIVKDGSSPAHVSGNKCNSGERRCYIIPPAKSTRFYAVGVDAQGASLGPVQVTWASTSGSPAGTADLQWAGPNFANDLYARTNGVVNLTATPTLKAIKGIVGKSSVYVATVAMSYGPMFDAASPALLSFVPGSLPTGASVPVPPVSETAPMQRMYLFAQTGAFSTPKITAALENVSKYPGIAMNYPISASPDVSADFTLSSSSDLTTESATIGPVGLHSTGLNSYVLNVRDFGASALLAIRIGVGQDTYTFSQQLPNDQDANGLPDAGWSAVPLAVTAAQTKLHWAIQDSDSEPPGPSQAGDGLSAFEEYRGFVVNGLHVRTNPKSRDLFIDADVGVSRDMFRELPFEITYVGEGETLNESIPRTTNSTLRPTATSGWLQRVRPVINPNRNGIPGARPTGQRGLRVIYQESLPPTRLFVRPTGTHYYENYLTGIGGIAFPETYKNFDVTNWMCSEDFPPPCNTVSYGSPNETVFVEVYPKLFENSGIATPNFANHVDSMGVAVQDCPTGDVDATNCDVQRDVNGVRFIRPYGRDIGAYYQLNSVLDVAQHPGDYRSKQVLTFVHLLGQCYPGTSRILTPTEFARLPAIAAAHEVMHGLTASHSSRCTSIMFSAPFDGEDRTMLDIFRIENNTPVPLTIGSEDKGGLKLWVP